MSWHDIVKSDPCPQSGAGVHQWLIKHTLSARDQGIPEQEVITTLESMMTRRPQRNEIANLLKGAANPKTKYNPETAEVARFNCDPIPVSIDDSQESMSLWIRHIYEEEETIFLSGGMSYDKFFGKAWKVDEADDLICNTPEAQHLFGNRKDGLYIKINPIKPDWEDTPSSKQSRRPTEWFETPNDLSGNWTSDVARFDNCLVEFDTGTIEEQRQIIDHARLPVRAQCLSGSQSLHSIIAIDAGTDRELYRKRTALVSKAIEASIKDLDLVITIKPDKVQDGVRWMRFGGATRLQDKQGKPLGVSGEGVVQEIVGLWECKWEAPVKPNPLADTLIDCSRTAAESIKSPILPPNEIMQGVFRAGDIVSLTASSKIGKTWELLRAGHAIASGGKWLGIQCNISSVLYLNFELHDYDMDRRLGSIFGESESGLHNLMILNLRGKQGDANAIMDALIHLTEQEKINAQLIIIDPIYRFYGDADENSNTDIANLLLEIVRFAKSINAAVLYAHHHAKGRNRQENMKAGEQQSGAGAFTRNYDANLNIAPMRGKDAPAGYSSLDFDLRNFAHIDSMIIRWDKERCQMVQVSEAEYKSEVETLKAESDEERNLSRSEFTDSFTQLFRDIKDLSTSELRKWIATRKNEIDEIDPKTASSQDAGWANRLIRRIKENPSKFGLILQQNGKGNPSTFSSIEKVA